MNIRWHRLFIRLRGVDEKRYRQLPNKASEEKSGFLSYLTGHKSKSFHSIEGDVTKTQEVDSVGELSGGKHTAFSQKADFKARCRHTVVVLSQNFTT